MASFTAIALRLLEARRLLLSSSPVTATAFAVGYVSPSQFSRDYKRMFGEPPVHDARFRDAGVRSRAG